MLFTCISAIWYTLSFLLHNSVLLKPNASQIRTNLEGQSELLYTKGICS